jgi:hypothetical protein
MNLEEFVRLDPKQIRRDKELMQLFVNFYEAAFSFTPKCAGCSFNSGFKKLKKYANNGQKIIKFDKKVNTMESKTFELKKEFKLKILTYKKDGITYRKYGHALDEDFARELVAFGKSNVFKTLPKKKDVVKEIKAKDVIAIDKYESMLYRDELFPLYKEVSERLDQKAKSNSKEDIIAFLRENES